MPDSPGPSTKGGQQLELLLQAFDGASPDPPQAAEVLSPPEEDGKPGQLAEILFTAPNL